MNPWRWDQRQPVWRCFLVWWLTLTVALAVPVFILTPGF